MDLDRYGWIIRLCALISSWPDVVIANSDAGVAFHASHGYRARRIEVIANGIDVQKFRPEPSVRADVRRELGIAPSDVVTIHVARVDAMKDHATFFAAMRSTIDVKGLCVGHGTDGLDLPSNVRALGARTDLDRLYAAADIVVSSSAFGEGFSNAIAEGMSAGLLPVVTDVGDARRIVGDTGSVVAPRDPAGLAAAIGEAAKLPAAERKRRGAAARERITANFTLDRAVEAFARLYAEG